MAIYRDTEVFCLSITGIENFQYRPLLLQGYSTKSHLDFLNNLLIILSHVYPSVRENLLSYLFFCFITHLVVPTPQFNKFLIASPSTVGIIIIIIDS